MQVKLTQLRSQVALPACLLAHTQQKAADSAAAAAAAACHAPYTSSL